MEDCTKLRRRLVTEAVVRLAARFPFSFISFTRLHLDSPGSSPVEELLRPLPAAAAASASHHSFITWRHFEERATRRCRTRRRWQASRASAHASSNWRDLPASPRALHLRPVQSLQRSQLPGEHPRQVDRTTRREEAAMMGGLPRVRQNQQRLLPNRRRPAEVLPPCDLRLRVSGLSRVLRQCESRRRRRSRQQWRKGRGIRRGLGQRRR